MSGAYPSYNDCCYFGVGIVRLAPAGGWQAGWAYSNPFYFDTNTNQLIIAPAFRDVGEANRLELNFRTKITAIPRYDGLGGEQSTVERLDGIDAMLGLDCVNVANLLQAFGGVAIDMPFQINGVDGYGYDWGLNWGANTTSAVPLPSGVPVVQILPDLRQTPPMALLFEGRNAITGTGVLVFIPKLQFSLAKRRVFISDDIAELSLTANVLRTGLYDQAYTEYLTT